MTGQGFSETLFSSQFPKRFRLCRARTVHSAASCRSFRRGLRGSGALAGILARPARRQKSPLLLGFRSELPVNGSWERSDGRGAWICTPARRPEAEHKFQHQRGEAT
jgi:hypothetical protein